MLRLRLWLRLLGKLMLLSDRLYRGIANSELESFGAAVFGMSSESVSSSKAVSAKAALVVSCLEMHLYNCKLKQA